MWCVQIDPDFFLIGAAFGGFVGWNLKRGYWIQNALGLVFVLPAAFAWDWLCDRWICVAYWWRERR